MRLLSGVKPTHRPHVGNYFGAMRQFVALQQRGPCFFFVADLHALNQVHDAALLREYSLGVALDYLAIGLDPARATLFVQSHVPEVSELDWILGTVTPMGLLQRAHAYKDALAKEKEVEFGLFAYPVLMAADILLYRADCVPVGKDQVQHVEITRDIAVKFNTLYCKGFDPKTGQGGALVLPEALVQDEVAVVPGTDGRKMSKSYGNTIGLREDPDAVAAKLKTMQTDPARVRRTDPGDPEKCPVWDLHKLYSSEDTLKWVDQGCRSAGIGCLECKKPLIDKVVADATAMRARAQEYEDNPELVRNILSEGAEKAREAARETLDEVRRAMHLRGD